MTPIRLLAPALFALAAVSCAPQKADQYDTADPYGTADAGAPAAPAQPAAPGNPVYDTPAAYEENSANAAANTAPVPIPPGDAAAAAMPAATPAVPAAPASNGAAIIHTVVKGDTLSGISAKYKVPAASIKQANRMTNDTVVLGRKMVIPPR